MKILHIDPLLSMKPLPLRPEGWPHGSFTTGIVSSAADPSRTVLHGAAHAGNPPVVLAHRAASKTRHRCVMPSRATKGDFHTMCQLPRAPGAASRCPTLPEKRHVL